MKSMVTKAVAGLLLGGVASLTGCHKPAPVHTVEWFQAHPADLAKTIAACRNNPGNPDNAANCVNAERAEFMNDAKGYAAPLRPVN